MFWPFRLLCVQCFIQMNVVIRKEAVMKYGMRKPSWNIYDAETNDMATKIHNNQCMVN